MKAWAIYLRQSLGVNVILNWCLIFTNFCINMQEHKLMSSSSSPPLLFIILDFFWMQTIYLLTM